VLQLVLLAGIQVFLELAVLALEFALLIGQLALARLALAFAQGGAFALELLGGGLECRVGVVQFLLAAREFLSTWPARPWRARLRA
jgi:hypothetical protein